MADNAQITPGSGLSIAADDIGSGVLAQRVKPVWGPDGTGTDVDVATALPVQSGWKELTGSATANNTDLVSTDAAGYRWVTIQVTGTFAATAAFQQSNDNTNWVSLPLGTATATSGQGSALTSASVTGGVFAGPLSCRYVRVRTTAYTSGTPAVVVDMWAVPPPVLSPILNSSLVVSGGQAIGSDATSLGSFTSVSVGSANFGWNGASWDRLRTPATFKSAAATSSGNTAVWTPGASKKFRLMRYKIDVSQDAAQSSGGVITIGLQDNTTDVGLSQSVFVPGAAATTMGPGWTSGWIDLGNGRISSTINQLLNVNLSAALTSGTVRVVAIGCEE
jgi:hypothetical protein